MCVSYSPYQTCAQICDVTAIVVAAIANLSQPFFGTLLPSTIDILNMSRGYMYSSLQNTSDFIDVNLLVPQGITLEATIDHPPNVDSDSDNDEDIVRGGKIPQSMPLNTKQERINVEVRQNVRETEKPTEYRVRKLFAKQGKNIKKPRNDQNLTARRHICRECKVEFTRGSNLRRHILNAHPNLRMALGNAHDGNCCCLSCNFRCRRIVDLQKHLTRVHNQVFRTDSLSFNNNEGNI